MIGMRQSSTELSGKKERGVTTVVVYDERNECFFLM
jgi:hypothetical protein